MGLEMLVRKLTIGMSIGMKTRMGGGMGGVNMALVKKRFLICSFLFK
jgi:hypothetical protein